MPQQIVRKSRVSKIPNTISGLLTRDVVNEVLSDLGKHRTEIQEIIVIYTDHDGGVYSNCTKGTKKATAVYLLEQEKLAIFNEED